ncbi:hypothetical protein [uncultured virus]|uniref:CBM6 domain-containing protein n=1 Tax=uncultured virus TaxID=340016 RepID=A0A218MKY7_9VIRU|nr:hypothetical protein [uncultured virus]
MPLNTGFEYLFSENELRTVRESVATPVKFAPINKTLASTNTAEDLITLESNAPPAMNLITNPSIETAGTPPSGFTAVGATVTRVTTTPRTGTYSMSCETANAAAAEGAYFEISDIPPGNYALSAYLRHSGGGTARVRGSSDEGSTFSNGTTVTMGNNWNGRSTVLHRVGLDESSIRIYIVTNVQQNITFLVDDVQVEPAWNAVRIGYSARDPNPPAAAVSTFVDPRSERFSRFLGTTDASASIREPGISEIHHLSIYASHNTYIDFDRTVAIRTATPLGYLLVAGIDYRINLDKIIKSKVSFANAAGSETPLVIGYATGF